MPTTDIPSIICLAIVFSLLPISQTLAGFLLRKSQSSPNNVKKGQQQQQQRQPYAKDYHLLLWHIFDVLTHFLIEGSYLYNSFFTSVPFNLTAPSQDAQRRGAKSFLNDTSRLYGAKYGNNATARLWQEYGKADRRWVESDKAIDVIALEILTVFVVGAAALVVCVLLVRSRCAYKAGEQAKCRRDRARMWMVAISVAVAELYGGWMTFAPEWLSGSQALETSNPVYLWLYLAFFNGIWVVVPAWVLSEAWREVQDAYVGGVGDRRGAANGAKQPATKQNSEKEGG